MMLVDIPTVVMFLVAALLLIMAAYLIGKTAGHSEGFNNAYHLFKMQRKNNEIQ